MGRAVLTLATGKPVYLQMAVNLARSFLLWNQNSNIRFVLATDQGHLLPSNLVGIDLIELLPGQYGEGFSPKLHLDQITPADQTVFVDADSLCVGNLDSVFERFKGRSVSVIGGCINSGEWFGDVDRICKRFGVKALPKFNGGIYYIEKGKTASSVFKRARELESEYDQIGLVRLRNRPNDELLIAIAMALNDQWGIPEDGTIMAEPLNFGCGLDIDVLNGTARLLNIAGHKHYRPAWPLKEARPLIVHFLGGHTDRSPYTREAMRLRKHVVDGWPVSLASVYAKAWCSAPQFVVESVKDTFRSSYRKLFGTRAIVQSNRI